MPSPIQILPPARTPKPTTPPTRQGDLPRDDFSHHLESARQKPDQPTETQPQKPATKTQKSSPAKKSAPPAKDQPGDTAQPTDTDTPTTDDAAPQPTDDAIETAPTDDLSTVPAIDEHEDKSKPDRETDPTLADALASLTHQPVAPVPVETEPQPDDAAAPETACATEAVPAAPTPATANKPSPEHTPNATDTLPISQADVTGPLDDETEFTDLTEAVDPEADTDPTATATTTPATKSTKPEKPLVSALGTPAPVAPADPQAQSTADQQFNDQSGQQNPEDAVNPDFVPADAHRSVEPHAHDHPGESADPTAGLNAEVPKPATIHAKSTQPATAQAPEVAFADSNHDNIVSSVRTQLAERGNGAMQIRLDPPELGALKVMVEMRDGVMTATFQTSNEDATRLLSHSLNQLKHSLETQGVTVDRIQVQQAPKSDSSNSPNDGQKQQQDQQSQNWQDDHAARQEQQRKELLKRMWQKLSGSNPVDVTA